MSAVFFRPACVRRRRDGCVPAPHPDRAVAGALGRRCADPGRGIRPRRCRRRAPARFQTGEQAALLLVEQTVEKQNGSLEFIRRYLESGSIGHQGDRLRGLPGADLIPSLPAIGGSVEEASGHFRSAQPSATNQIVEGILDLGVERISQFVGEPAAGGLINEGLDGGHEGAVTGEPNRIVTPQADVVEACNFAKGIEAAAVSIAGQVIQEFELAKDGEVGSGAQSTLEFGQGGDLVAQQVLAELVGIEEEWAHNVIVPTVQVFHSEL